MHIQWLSARILPTRWYHIKTGHPEASHQGVHEEHLTSHGISADHQIKAAIGIGRLYSPGIAQYAAQDVCFLRLDEQNGSDQSTRPFVHDVPFAFDVTMRRPMDVACTAPPLSVLTKVFSRGE
ncbi:hypothetical protein ARMSODRAFT_1028297 [Armillaria solidipes]|uniref:Uncharacterized protein n=1 Tax=Armillaria solidipes TaxID=1076256 RepID=A0A2H3AKV0_9AGAR|nr:hypothetical protein ARMSODRAFT_1028297 [Armillaria solidipes]